MMEGMDGRREAEEVAEMGTPLSRGRRLRPPAPGFVAVAWLAGLIAPAMPLAAGETTIGGRVVEKGTGRPIVGAEVRVSSREGLRGRAAGEAKAQTDDDGRFALSFPGEADRAARRTATVWVRHPEYVPLSTGAAIPLRRLLAEPTREGTLAFRPIELMRGVEHTGLVLRPDETPAAGVAYTIWCAVAETEPTNFLLDLKGKTDAQGRIRVRMPRTAAISVQLDPDDLAPMAHHRNSNNPMRPALGIIPTDLGRFLLDAGIVVRGRVVGLDGRPRTGVRVAAHNQQTGQSREAVTDDRGEFRFAPLAAGPYYVAAAGSWGRNRNNGEPHEAPPFLIEARVGRIVPGSTPEPFDLRELPAVTVTARLVDRRGRPVRGLTVYVSGQVHPQPAAAGGAAAGRAGRPNRNANAALDGNGMFGEPMAPGRPQAPWMAPIWNAVLAPFQPDPRVVTAVPFAESAQGWNSWAESDETGRAILRAPKGLQNATIFGDDPSSTYVIKTRPTPDAAPLLSARRALGVLEKDSEDVEFLLDRSPAVLVRLAMEDGTRLPEALNISAWNVDGPRSYNVGVLEREAEGRYRIRGLVPDGPFLVLVNANGVTPGRYEGIAPPEGDEAEVEIHLERPYPPAKTGDLAPPILVTSIDGRARSLTDYAGRHVLLYVWSAQNARGGGLDDLVRLQALRDRFGEDRLGMLGLSFDLDPKARVLEELVKERKLDWPQARLGAQFDAIRAAYNWRQYPCATLVGPDGTIVATDLQGDAIARAVEDALK